jgi:acetyltransferase
MTSIVDETPALPHRWVLPNGTPAMLRRISALDFDIETEFVDGLSADTSYNRLFSTRHPGPLEIERWTNIDTSHEEALIVTGERDGAEFMLGVARYVRDDTGPDAEFAIVIGDAWKRCGLGLVMISALVSLARAAGVRELYGTTLSTNAAMLALGLRLGFAARRDAGEGTVTRLGRRLA